MSKITVKNDKCIGCGACQVACDELFELTKEYVTLKDAKETGNNQVLETDNIKCAEDAADVCPVQCIIIEK